MKKILQILVNVILFSFLTVESKLLRSIQYKFFKHTKYVSDCSKFSYYTQNVNHFKLEKGLMNETYQQRYILSSKYWVPGNPIFFYTGNEGDIQWFCENTGAMWELAQKFSAMVVFAEHRYYGTSMPFGNKSYESPQIDYLTSEQALADFAYLVSFIKKENKAENSPVVAFGGSYGGMLSAWARMKYPNIFCGAVSASAPVFQVVTDCSKFNQVITNAFKKGDPMCPVLIRDSWNAINSLNNSNGLSNLTSIFKLCKPLSNIDSLKAWLNDIYGNVAMANYPYAANFLNNLPAWPVNELCAQMVKSSGKNFSHDPYSLLSAIYNGINVYANYTGQTECNDVESGEPADISMTAWSYQTCTEFVFPFCSNGVTDMYEPQDWDYPAYAADCLKNFGITPRKEWTTIFYGTSTNDYRAHSNIIFSNGDLDPWSSGGVLETINPSLEAVVIENGAHHLDLRASNVNDPKSVILARIKEINAIQRWISEYTIE